MVRSLNSVARLIGGVGVDKLSKENVCAGDRFRSAIDDAWWCGKIVSRNKNAQSPFLCYKIRWDNNEDENLSPWDLEALNSRSEYTVQNAPLLDTLSNKYIK